MTINIGDGRPLRGCALCGGVDDHPRHGLGRTVAARYPEPSDDIISKIINASPDADRARIVREMTGGRGTYRHIDCCRQAGCPDGSCNGAPDLRGADLLAAIMTKAG